MGRSRERVLVFGVEGTGKSLCLLDIAARVWPNKVWVIDNDNAWDRMLEGQTLAGDEVAVAEEWRWVDGDWVEDDRWVADGGNVVVFHVDGWEAETAAIVEVVERAAPDDWCGIDSGSALWDDVQEWYTHRVFDSSMDDYFLKVRLEKERAAKDSKSLGALDGWLDWPVVNAQYKTKVMKFLVTPPCHLLVTAEQADVTKEDVDKETRALYGGTLVKPRGQKRLGHNMQTVLNLRRESGEKFSVRTVKDRGGRERFAGEDVTGMGFGEWYLEGVGGWAEVEAGAKAESKPVSVVKKVAAKSVVAKQIVAKG